MRNDGCSAFFCLPKFKRCINRGKSRNNKKVKEGDFMRISVNETIGVIEVWATANEANKANFDMILREIFNKITLKNVKKKRIVVFESGDRDLTECTDVLIRKNVWSEQRGGVRTVLRSIHHSKVFIKYFIWSEKAQAYLRYVIWFFCCILQAAPCRPQGYASSFFCKNDFRLTNVFVVTDIISYLEFIFLFFLSPINCITTGINQIGKWTY